MAILVANPDGSSNAKAGDVVVTGGGIFRKNADGSSTKMSDLKDYIGSSTTKDYSKLSTIARSFQSRQSAEGGISGTYNEVAKDTQKSAKSDSYIPTGIDDNGIVSGITGFVPVDYSTGTAASSTGASKVIGYVILGLVGLVVLDRLLDDRGRK